MITELALKFKPTQVLKSDTQTKSLVILGKIDQQLAICTLEKSAFPNSATSSLDEIFTDILLINTNDVYYWLLANLIQDIEKAPGVKVNFIWPASETHIRKYSPQKWHLVQESPATYNQVVKPFIDTQRGDRIQWVYNILFKGKESELFIYHDPHPETGFVLLPDMKWDRVSMDLMYLIAIVNRCDIASVRDIDGSHVDFLLRLKREIFSTISNKFSVSPDQFRMFVHYQPSYYHFHIHVVNLAHPGLGDGLNAGKAILFDDVIDNVKLMPDFYQKRTLTYQLGENHKLWELLNQEE